MIGHQKVLVPVSGKFRLERAKQALEHALQIVREDGEIGFIHCTLGSYLISGEAHKKLVIANTREAEKLFKPLLDRVKNAGIAYCVHIADGSPGTQVPKFASEKKFNIVVMCTGGRTASGHYESTEYVIGSVTDYMLRYLNVPLYIVRLCKNNPSLWET